MDRRLLIRRTITGVVVVSVIIAALVRSYLLQRFDGLSLLFAIAAVVVVLAAVLGAFDREAGR